MNCYLCEAAQGAGGTHLGVSSAVGVCKGCGIGLCFRHAHRSVRAGGLVCLDCRQRAEVVEGQQEMVAADAARHF